MQYSQAIAQKNLLSPQTEHALHRAISRELSHKELKVPLSTCKMTFQRLRMSWTLLGLNKKAKRHNPITNIIPLCNFRSLLWMPLETEKQKTLLLEGLQPKGLLSHFPGLQLPQRSSDTRKALQDSKAVVSVFHTPACWHQVRVSNAGSWTPALPD